MFPWRLANLIGEYIDYHLGEYGRFKSVTPEDVKDERDIWESAMNYGITFYLDREPWGLTVDTCDFVSLGSSEFFMLAGAS